MKDTQELLEYLRSMPRDSIILIDVKAEDYMKVSIDVLKVLVNEDKLPGVYITVNKPYATMKRILAGAGVKAEKMYFIDCITKMAGGEVIPNDKNVFYLDSPQNLTGLGVAMAEAITAIKGKEKFLFMDSLSTLLLYHNSGTVAKFSHFLTGRMRVWSLRGILMAIERETDPEFTNQLSPFCDAVVKLENKT
jgi:KaiC/GvpD/RAD55 family RecA-like ATPase